MRCVCTHETQNVCVRLLLSRARSPSLPPSLSFSLCLSLHDVYSASALTGPCTHTHSLRTRAYARGRVGDGAKCRCGAGDDEEFSCGTEASDSVGCVS